MLGFRGHFLTKSRRYSTICFHARPTGGKAREDGSETKAVRWVEPAELAALNVHPSMRRRITDQRLQLARVAGTILFTRRVCPAPQTRQGLAGIKWSATADPDDQRLTRRRTWIELPALDVHGNSNPLMADESSDGIAAIVLDWLRGRGL